MNPFTSIFNAVRKASEADQAAPLPPPPAEPKPMAPPGQRPLSSEQPFREGMSEAAQRELYAKPVPPVPKKQEELPFINQGKPAIDNATAMFHFRAPGISPTVREVMLGLQQELEGVFEALSETSYYAALKAAKQQHLELLKLGENAEVAAIRQSESRTIEDIEASFKMKRQPLKLAQKNIVERIKTESEPIISAAEARLRDLAQKLEAQERARAEEHHVKFAASLTLATIAQLAAGRLRNEFCHFGSPAALLAVFGAAE